MKNLGRLLVLFAAFSIASFQLGCGGGGGSGGEPEGAGEMPSGIPDGVEDPALTDDAAADAPTGRK